MGRCRAAGRGAGARLGAPGQLLAGLWRAWVAPLRAAGYRVVAALAGPAPGVSAGRQVDLVPFGEAVAAVLASAGVVRAVLAHSFGAASVARLPAGAQLPRLMLVSAPFPG